MSNRKSFCVVCIANYCRSPVLEAFLKARYKDKYEFYSAGLSPLQKPNMDPRSYQYLEENGLKNIIHNPKKITKSMLSYFDYFIAIDSYVLTRLNSIYPKYSHKFYLATSDIDNINLIDPYKMNNEGYKEIMDKIKLTALSINL